MQKSLWMFVVVSVLAGFALAEPVVAQQSGARPNIFAPAATPSGPLVDVVNSIVMAFNNQDKTYFQKEHGPLGDATAKAYYLKPSRRKLGYCWLGRLQLCGGRGSASVEGHQHALLQKEW